MPNRKIETLEGEFIEGKTYYLHGFVNFGKFIRRTPYTKLSLSEYPYGKLRVTHPKEIIAFEVIFSANGKCHFSFKGFPNTKIYVIGHGEYLVEDLNAIGASNLNFKQKDSVLYLRSISFDSYEEAYESATRIFNSQIYWNNEYFEGKIKELKTYSLNLSEFKGCKPLKSGAKYYGGLRTNDESVEIWTDYWWINRERVKIVTPYLLKTSGIKDPACKDSYLIKSSNNGENCIFYPNPANLYDSIQDLISAENSIIYNKIDFLTYKKEMIEGILTEQRDSIPEKTTA